MAPEKGNTYWKLAKGFAVGVKRKYTPEELWDKAIEYFEWIENNPLVEEKGFGSGIVIKLNKMRAMTITGFCIYANITRQTFENYSNENVYIDIVTRIRDIIYTQKFEGASADLLNANIIARELGLADKVDSDVSIKKGTVNIDKWIDDNTAQSDGNK